MSTEPKRAGDNPKIDAKATATTDAPRETVVGSAPSAPSFQPPAHPAGTGASSSAKDAAKDATTTLKRGVDDALDGAKDSVKDTATDAAAAARRAAGDLKAQAVEAAGALRGTASSVLSSVTDQASGVAEDLKTRGADAAGGVVKALRAAGGELDHASPLAAGYVRDAADAADRVIQDLRQRPINDLAADAVAFARRQPTAFFAGAIILGFAASRFLKSAPPKDHRYPAGPDARREVRPDEFV